MKPIIRRMWCALAVSCAMLVVRGSLLAQIYDETPAPSTYIPSGVTYTVSDATWHIHWFETLHPGNTQGIIWIRLDAQQRVEGGGGRDAYFETTVVMKFHPPALAADKPDMIQNLVYTGRSESAAVSTAMMMLDILKMQPLGFISASPPATKLYSWITVGTASQTMPGEVTVGSQSPCQADVKLDVPLTAGANYRILTTYFISDHYDTLFGGGYNHYQYASENQAGILLADNSKPPREPVVMKKTFTVGVQQTQTNVERDVGFSPVNYTLKEVTLTITGPSEAFDPNNEFYVAGIGYRVGTGALKNSAGVVTLPFLSQITDQHLTWSLSATALEVSTQDVERPSKTISGDLVIPGSP